jgi:hypothetical protein
LGAVKPPPIEKLTGFSCADAIDALKVMIAAIAHVVK